MMIKIYDNKDHFFQYRNSFIFQFNKYIVRHNIKTWIKAREQDKKPVLLPEKIVDDQIRLRNCYKYELNRTIFTSYKSLCPESLDNVKESEFNSKQSTIKVLLYQEFKEYYSNLKKEKFLQ